MKNKGQVAMQSIGALILILIAVVVGVALVFDASADNIASITQEREIINISATFPANGANLTLVGQSVRNFVAVNQTNPASAVTSTNYTVTTGVLVNNELVTILTAKASPYNGRLVNLSYIAEPFGYQTSGASRSVMDLIIVFGALIVLVVAITPVLRNGFLELIGAK